MSQDPILQYHVARRPPSRWREWAVLFACIFVVVLALKLTIPEVRQWWAARQYAAQQQAVRDAYVSLLQSCQPAEQPILCPVGHPTTNPAQLGWSGGSVEGGGADPTVSEYRPPAWDAYLDQASLANLNPTWNPQGAIALVGPRLSLGGDPCLVVVSARRHSSYRHTFALRLQRLTPDATGRPDFGRARAFYDSVLIMNEMPKPFVVLAAKPHPADAAVVIIPFQAGDLTGEVHARLMPDATFEFRTDIGVVLTSPARQAPAVDLWLTRDIARETGATVHVGLSDSGTGR